MKKALLSVVALLVLTAAQPTTKIDQLLRAKSATSLSSNPYDYVKNNQAFADVVALGHAALPELHHRLKGSKQDGLDEYVLAIAIERISRAQFGTKRWLSGKGFLPVWQTYLHTLPKTVRQVAVNKTLTGAMREKTYIGLGVPAIPFLLEEVEKGNETAFRAVRTLAHVKGNVTAKEWVKQHKADYSALRKYVLDAK